MAPAGNKSKTSFFEFKKVVLEAEVILNKDPLAYLEDDAKYYPPTVNILMNKYHITRRLN